MNLLTRFLALAQRARTLIPNAVQIEPMDLDHDWPDIESLLRLEQWPFVRADFELGDAQPGDVSFVARKNGVFAGFFAAHIFQGPEHKVGYLDMMIIHPDYRSRTVARPLYLATIEAVHKAGGNGLVVHTTNDSARLIELLGFEASTSFTLLSRDPAPGGRGLLKPATLESLQAHDTAAFGIVRTAWTCWLEKDPRVSIREMENAVVVLRPRENNSLSLDGCYASKPEALEPLVAAVVSQHGEKRALMAFAATDGPLHHALLAHGFTVPDFFVPIGPLREWRQGHTHPIGSGDRVYSLLWL